MRGREDRPRYDPEKVRRRAEEALGWEPGASAGMTFDFLREALKAKPEKWKAARDIDDMLRTGDHLVGTESQLSVPGVGAGARVEYLELTGSDPYGPPILFDPEGEHAADCGCRDCNDGGEDFTEPQYCPWPAR